MIEQYLYLFYTYTKKREDLKRWLLCVGRRLLGLSHQVLQAPTAILQVHHVSQLVLLLRHLPELESTGSTT